MRQYAIATLAAFTLSYSAYGADMPLKAFEAAPSFYNWTGFYAGAHLDYQAGQSRWSESRFGAFGAGGEFALGQGYDGDRDQLQYRDGILLLFVPCGFLAGAV
jgi:hypothetical protein